MGLGKDSEFTFEIEVGLMAKANLVNKPKDQGQSPAGAQNTEHQLQVAFGVLKLDLTTNLVAH